MKLFGQVCVYCTTAAIGLLSLVTLVTLIWTSMV